MSATLVTFRVHFASGGTHDVVAATPSGARVEAKRLFPEEIVTKVKVVRS